jgi:hypothetical protein
VLIVLILLLVFWPLVVELVLALVAGLVSTVAKKEVLGGAIILLSLAIIAIAIVGCGKALEWSEDTITYTMPDFVRHAAADQNRHGFHGDFRRHFHTRK